MSTDTAHHVPGLAQHEADVEKGQRASEQAAEEWRTGDFEEEDVHARFDELADDALQHIYVAAGNDAEAAGQSRYGSFALLRFFDRFYIAGAGAVVKRIRDEWLRRRINRIMEGE